ncbi:uncharacterized protein METZ01_LOCUS326995, partial [marine metagenome]
MRQIVQYLITLIFFLSPAKATLAEVGVSINLHNSQIEGVFDSDNELFIFRGIPYAKPPIGDLRWTSPVPLSTDPKVINAQSF